MFGLQLFWTPAHLLCAGCQANYTLIGHADHFNDDIKVAARLLNIEPEFLPDNFEKVNINFTTNYFFD